MQCFSQQYYTERLPTKNDFIILQLVLTTLFKESGYIKHTVIIMLWFNFTMYPWFNFYFPLFYTHHHVHYHKKNKGIKKLNQG